MLPILRNFNKNTTKYQAAEVYLAQGFSLIPVQSNKRSAVKWKAFQQQQPTLTQVQQWFARDSQLGIGIITGRISKLAVLDFDTAEQFREFIQKYPALILTYTVKTRRGWHLYYQIPDNLHTRSLKGPGIDWQFEGRYVVAPPTSGYEIIVSLPILRLTQAEINAIEAFVQPQTPSCATQTQSITQQELIGHYIKQARVGQRNEALFKTGLLARDHGWTLEETIQLLSTPHAHFRLHDERIKQRMHEGVATLRSVFSRPARQQSKWLTLPNLIREKLFQMGLTCVIRVWEALHQFDYEAGMSISHDEAWEILAGIVGKHSIRKSFTATNQAGQPLFEYIESHENPSPRTPTHEASAIQTPQGITRNAFVREKNPEEILFRGRKSKFYRIPSIVELARLLGVKVGSIRDELSLDDLKTAKSTRTAAHRGFIKRRPGKYPRKWLAQRLGVTVVTKNRYDKEIADLYKKATYTMKPIYTRSLNAIPADDLDVPGMFLEDDTGKRWPAKQVIAAKLLKQGRRVTLMKQGVNYYWVGSRFDYDIEQLRFIPLKSRNSSENWRKNAEAYWQQEPPEAISVAQKQVKQPNSSDFKVSKTLPITGLKNTSQIQSIQQHNPRRAFRESYLEDGAKSLQKRINKLVQSAEQQINLRTVRQLMIDYGHSAVLKVIKCVEKRNNVDNLVGLIIVILRSEKRMRELQLIS